MEYVFPGELSRHMPLVSVLHARLFGHAAPEWRPFWAALPGFNAQIEAGYSILLERALRVAPRETAAKL